MFKARVVRAKEYNQSAWSGGHTRNIFSISLNMKVFLVFSLESPHRGDDDEYTQ